jgi:hypothetical protein
MTNEDPLPVPAQLEAQLAKCQTVRSAKDFYKPRTKTPQVSISRALRPFDDSQFKIVKFKKKKAYLGSMKSIFLSEQEIEASKAKLPPLPSASK